MHQSIVRSSILTEVRPSSIVEVRHDTERLIHERIAGQVAHSPAKERQPHLQQQSKSVNSPIQNTLISARPQDQLRDLLEHIGSLGYRGRIAGRNDIAGVGLSARELEGPICGESVVGVDGDEDAFIAEVVDELF